MLVCAKTLSKSSLLSSFDNLPHRSDAEEGAVCGNYSPQTAVEPCWVTPRW